MSPPSEALDKVFDRFYRVDNTARRSTGGVGLGLALVREIVSAHGGRVWVESTVETGSTFYIALPVLDNAQLQP
jgi:signal transduction histidine kinase